MKRKANKIEPASLDNYRYTKKRSQYMHVHDWGKRRELSLGCLELDGYLVYVIN